MTHDEKRLSTTTLFAALDTRAGRIIGEYQPRHRAKDFINFLRRIDRGVRKALDIYCVLDNHDIDPMTDWYSLITGVRSGNGPMSTCLQTRWE
jgi:hypothetical protein